MNEHHGKHRSNERPSLASAAKRIGRAALRWLAGPPNTLTQLANREFAPGSPEATLMGIAEDLGKRFQARGTERFVPIANGEAFEQFGADVSRGSSVSTHSPISKTRLQLRANVAGDQGLGLLFGEEITSFAVSRTMTDRGQDEMQLTIGTDGSLKRFPNGTPAAAKVGGPKSRTFTVSEGQVSSTVNGMEPKATSPEQTLANFNQAVGSINDLLASQPQLAAATA